MGTRTGIQQVRAILTEALDECPVPAGFRPLLEIPLSQRGKALSDSPTPRWPYLVLSSCAATGVDTQAGARVAAAVEAFLAGADVIDDMQDDDPSPLVEAAGLPQALNVGSALLVLAHDILARLGDDGVPRERIPSFTQTFSQGALRSAGGQYLDLAMEGRTSVGTEEAFAIVRAKAGALGGMASRLGALVGTDDEHVLGLYEAFGTQIGIIAQINNDLRDAVEGADDKTDVVRQKRTLPFVYRSSLSSDGSARAGERRSEPGIDAETHAFIRVVLEAELHRARAIIEQLADQGQNVAPLLELLD